MNISWSILTSKWIMNFQFSYYNWLIFNVPYLSVYEEAPFLISFNYKIFVSIVVLFVWSSVGQTLFWLHIWFHWLNIPYNRWPLPNSIFLANNFCSNCSQLKNICVFFYADLRYITTRLIPNGFMARECVSMLVYCMNICFIFSLMSIFVQNNFRMNQNHALEGFAHIKTE